MGRMDPRDVEQFQTAEGHDERDSRSADARRPPRGAGVASVVLGLVLAAAACTAPSQAGASREVPISGGPSINRILTGGAARDLTLEEVEAIYRGHGIPFPR